ncbi:unnamed protein product [Toxocara canis]|uniref:Calpain catalytic domain-containing protein n=1 Tax=Toxocara canis TaxID=6265 RepID=A0A183U9B0_TOXCA|nr:unnamed protein product [Toxocara canis]
MISHQSLLPLLLVISREHHILLVRLRNPWGTFVWNKEWSDSWSGWTAQARAVLLPDGTEAGTFWMPFTRFLQHFDTQKCVLHSAGENSGSIVRFSHHGAEITSCLFPFFAFLHEHSRFFFYFPS